MCSEEGPLSDANDGSIKLLFSSEGAERTLLGGGIRRGSRNGRGETGGFDIDIRRDLKRLNRVLTRC